jgi:hypothetical protein
MDYLPTLSIICTGDSAGKHPARILLRLIDTNRPRLGGREVRRSSGRAAVIEDRKPPGNEKNTLRRYLPHFGENAHPNSYWLGEGVDTKNLEVTKRHSCLLRCAHCQREVNVSEEQALTVVDALLSSKTYRVELRRLAGIRPAAT